jgi:hypothetical protein
LGSPVTRPSFAQEPAIRPVLLTGSKSTIRAKRGLIN